MGGIRDSITANASRKTNFANLILRIFQLIFAIVVVGFYAYYIKQDFTQIYEWDWKGKEGLAIAVGSLSIITSVAFAIIPALVSYYSVAIGFIWDLILFFIWCAVFGWFRAQNGIQYPTRQQEHKDDYERFAQMNWINLVNMLLWLVTAFFGISCLLADRKSLRFCRSAI